MIIMDKYIYLKPYDWKDGDNIEENVHYIDIYAHNKNSDSCFIRFPYTPHFYVRLPPLHNKLIWNKEDIDEVITILKIKSNRGKSCIDGCVGITILNCRTFEGYLDGPKSHLKLCFKTKKHLYDAKNKIEKLEIKLFKSLIKLEVNEANIESVRQFTVEQGIPNSYSDWIAISVDNIIKITNEDDKITRFKYEYRCLSTDICAIPNEYKDEISTWRVYPKIIGYDIEAFSSNKSKFPNAYNPSNVCFMISITFYVNDHPQSKRKICIVYGDAIPPPDVEVYYKQTEKEMIDTFCQLLNDLDVDILIGHYNLGFDDWYLNQRYVNLWLNWPDIASRIKGIIPKFQNASWSSNNTKTVSVKYIDFPGRIFFDTKRIAESNILKPLPNYKLETVAQAYLSRSKREMSYDKLFSILEQYQQNYKSLCNATKSVNNNELIPYENISVEAWNFLISQYNKSLEEMGILIDYCSEDSNLVVDIFEKLNVWINVCQTSNIFQVRSKDIYIKGQQYKCFSQLYSILKNNNDIDPFGVVFNMFDGEIIDSKYEGALNWGTIKQYIGYFKELASIDVVSMYPSIIGGDNLCISTEITKDKDKFKLYEGHYDRHSWKETKTGDEYDISFVHKDIHIGFFPRLVDQLLINRRKIKEEMKSVTEDSYKYTELNAKQNALKISANSVYGMLGTRKNPKIPAKHIAALVTKIGRDISRKMAEFLEYGGDPSKPAEFPKCEIIYGDTDSLQFRILDKHLTTLERINISKKITNGINKYIAPCKVEFEKYGDLYIITPKKYIYHLRDISLNNYDGSNNINYGKYISKNGYKHIGTETIKRNQPKVLKRLYENIINGVMNADLKSLGIITNDQSEEEQRLQYIIDNIFKEMFLLIRNKNPKEDYLVYESYNGDNSKLALLAINMASIGKPIQIGERVGYLVVESANKNNKKAQNYRLIDAIASNERIDINNYVTKMIKPIDTALLARYYKTNVYENWFKKKNIANKIIELLHEKNISTINITNNINTEILNIIKNNIVDINLEEFYTYTDFIDFKSKDIYKDRFTIENKNKITRQITLINKTGLKLALETPNIIENISLARDLNILVEYSRIMMSPEAFKLL